MKALILYDNGDYPFEAPEDLSPGDLVARPDGTLAVFHGFDTAAAGDLINADPVAPGPVVEIEAASAAVSAVGTVYYWDATAKQATATEGANTRLGPLIRAKVAGETSVQINTVA